MDSSAKSSIVELFTMSEYKERLLNFKKHYDIQNIITVPTKKSSLHSDKIKKRKCRFCKQSSPETTFNNESHTIPRCIGNKYGINDFECDQCNSYFQPFESALAYYLGLHQALDFNRKVKLKSNLATFSHEVIQEKNVIKILSNENNEGVEKIGDEIKITFRKGGYIPINVFKALLKIALSVLPEEEVFDYRVTIDYLMGKLSLDGSKFQCISVYEFPLDISMAFPFVILFKKKSEDINQPTHHVSIYFQNKIFSLFIPLNFIDRNLYKDNFNYSIPPPLSSKEINSEMYHQFYLEDLYSAQPAKQQEQIMILKGIDEKGEAAAFDPVTGKLGAIDNTLKGIVLVPSGTRFSIKSDVREDSATTS